MYLCPTPCNCTQHEGVVCHEEKRMRNVRKHDPAMCKDLQATLTENTDLHMKQY